LGVSETHRRLNHQVVSLAVDDDPDRQAELTVLRIDDVHVPLEPGHVDDLRPIGRDRAGDPVAIPRQACLCAVGVQDEEVPVVDGVPIRIGHLPTDEQLRAVARPRERLAWTFAQLDLLLRLTSRRRFTAQIPSSFPYAIQPPTSEKIPSAFASDAGVGDVSGDGLSDAAVVGFDVGAPTDASFVHEDVPIKEDGRREHPWDQRLASDVMVVPHGPITHWATPGVSVRRLR
jgi:hypothetical protein